MTIYIKPPILGVCPFELWVCVCLDLCEWKFNTPTHPPYPSCCYGNQSDWLTSLQPSPSWVGGGNRKEDSQLSEHCRGSHILLYCASEDFHWHSSSGWWWKWICHLQLWMRLLGGGWLRECCESSLQCLAAHSLVTPPHYLAGRPTPLIAIGMWLFLV